MTAARPARFVLVDPCLTGLGSHPYHYAALVLAAAARAGRACRLVTHRDFTAAPADWSAMPVFTHTAYSKYTLYGGLDRLDDRGRPPLLPDLPWTTRHARRRREERIAAFAREVRPAIDGLAAGDVVLVATASELEAVGLARAIAAARPPQGIHWHVQFHFPILKGFGGDAFRQEGRLAETRRMLLQATAAAGHTVLYHATTEELAAQYRRLVAGPVDTLPYPVEAPVRGRRDRAATFRVACLGDARPEKHSEALAAIVAAVAGDAELAGRLRFAIQTNPGYPPDSRRREHVAVSRSLAALARAARHGGPVEWLGGPLDAATYARELAAADIVLLPYDQSRYRDRCSGVVLEALAAGAVPILTGGGWMARQLATPLAAHADGIVARGRPLATRRIDRPRIGRRPLAIERAASPAAATTPDALVVEIAWGPGDGSPLDAPPVRVHVAGAAVPPTVLAPGTARCSRAVFPLGSAPAAGRRVEISAACPAAAVTPAAIVIRELAVAGPLPAAAVGLVIDAPCDVPAALREVVRHADHYLTTAATHSETVRRTANADAVVRRLLP